MNWTPIAGNVILKSHKREQTDSGLFIPETAQKNIGEVVAATAGYYTSNGAYIESELSVGDLVYLPNSAQEVDLDGDKYFVCHEAELRIKKINQL